MSATASAGLASQGPLEELRSSSPPASAGGPLPCPDLGDSWCLGNPGVWDGELSPAGSEDNCLQSGSVRNCSAPVTLFPLCSVELNLEFQVLGHLG